MSALATLLPVPVPAPLAPDRAALRTVAYPAYGRPADVADRYVLAPAHSPVEHLRPRCEAGRHHLMLLIDGN